VVGKSTSRVYWSAINVVPLHAVVRYFQRTARPTPDALSAALREAAQVATTFYGCVTAPPLLDLLKQVKPNIPAMLPAGDGALLGSIILATRERSATHARLVINTATWVGDDLLSGKQKSCRDILQAAARSADDSSGLTAERVAEALRLNAQVAATDRLVARYAAAGALMPDFTQERSIEQATTRNIALGACLRRRTITPDEAADLLRGVPSQPALNTAAVMAETGRLFRP
jgi:hypothetical protein